MQPNLDLAHPTAKGSSQQGSVPLEMLHVAPQALFSISASNTSTAKTSAKRKGSLLEMNLRKAQDQIDGIRVLATTETPETEDVERIPNVDVDVNVEIDNLDPVLTFYESRKLQQNPSLPITEWATKFPTLNLFDNDNSSDNDGNGSGGGGSDGEREALIAAFRKIRSNLKANIRNDLTVSEK